jgi:glycerate kinase
LSDGGEGLLAAVGGDPRWTTVEGPLGEETVAEWRWLEPDTAVIEMARAAGRDLLPQPVGDQPMRASTRGVGQLILAATGAGASRIVVGCGGSATTDGGWGAVEVVGSPATLAGRRLEVATDVTTAFGQAAAVFGPQKGATPEQVGRLTERLDTLAERYRHAFGVDVSTVPGAGAAGGLAGGLVALGGRVVAGFDVVADAVDLAPRLAAADVVVTGEGHLDRTSLLGKVVGGVVALAGDRPVLCVVGDADPGLAEELGPRVRVVTLVDRAGATAARARPVELVAEVVAEHLSA